jgi:hypothetical protein
VHSGFMRWDPSDDPIFQRKGAFMRKFLLASVAVAGLASSTFALTAYGASGGESAGPDVARIQRMLERQAVMLDAHLAAMKAGLKLAADQEKNWPAFESAIRDAEKAREDRWRQVRERMSQGERPSPIERMTIMSEHLKKVAAQLQLVAAASRPLYDSLADEQKRAFGPLMREFRLRGRHEGGHR